MNVGNEPEIDGLVNEITVIVERQVIQSTDCRFYNVPYHIRRWNSEAYTPQVISIGPFHHNNPRLRDMEAIKERYLGHFARRGDGNLGHLVGIVRNLEIGIRGYYDGGAVGFTSDDFVKMILVDACFILELLIRHIPSSLGMRSLNDPMAVEPRDAPVILDLILLENQLPFFVIEELYHLVSPSLRNAPWLPKLCFSFFDQFNVYSVAPDPDIRIEHFTDLLRTFLVPPLAQRRIRGYGMVSRLYTATQLHEAGVKFKRGATGVKFENGVLEIPTTVLDDWEEVIARNIIALEQTCYIEDGYFTDYFIFMDLFIRTREDLDLLSDKKIFHNNLSDSYAAVSMIKNLTKGILSLNVNEEYGDLCRSLNQYYEEPWHRRRARLKRDYFSSPSATASAIFTVGVITVLTLIQTVCSIMQVTGSGKG